jgi:hypothetical protein
VNLQRVALLVIVVVGSAAMPAAAQENESLREPLESDCVCPKEGRWIVTNLEGWMQCVGTFGMKRKLKAKDKNRGIIWILDEDCSSLFEEAGERKREDVVMERVEGCDFEGTVRGVEEGVEVVINGTHTVVSEDFITGEAYWNMEGPDGEEDNEGEEDIEGEEGKKSKKSKKDKKRKGGKLGVAMGMSCKAYRPYEIAFEEPLSDEEYPKLKERMEKKLEKVRGKD